MSKYYNLNRLLSKNPDILSPLYEAAPVFTPEKKDMDRIKSMCDKARSATQLWTLANKMANAIKGIDKMVRRYRAAVISAGENSEPAKVFADAIIKMGYEPQLRAFQNGDTQAFEKTPDVMPAGSSVNNVVQTAPASDPEPNDEIQSADEENMVEVRMTSAQKTKLARDAAKKLNQELDNNEYIKIGGEGDTTFDNIDFQTVKKIQELQKFYSSKLAEYDPLDKLQTVADEFKDTAKRWTITELRINKISAIGNVYVTCEIVKHKKVKSRYYYNEFETQDTSYKVTDVAYNILKEAWYFGNACFTNSSYRGYYSRHSEDVVKIILPVLQALQTKFTSCLKKHKYISTLMEKFKMLYAHLYDKEHITSRESYFTDHEDLKIKRRSLTKMSKIAEQIIYRIEDKFGYSDEPGADPKEEPGYTITAITPDYVRFQSRSRDNSKCLKMLHAMGLITDFVNKRADYFNVPIDDLVNALKD